MQRAAAMPLPVLLALLLLSSPPLSPFSTRLAGPFPFLFVCCPPPCPTPSSYPQPLPYVAPLCSLSSLQCFPFLSTSLFFLARFQPGRSCFSACWRRCTLQPQRVQLG
eukprot:jgi/Mesvir1/23817/Mv10628-RA.1